MADIDEDWEEWDGVSPFWNHCLAGSFAGLAEHTLVYPLDTVRTHIQVCANCKFNPAFNSNNAATATNNINAVKSAVGSSSSSTSSKGALHSHSHSQHALSRTGRPLTAAASASSSATATSAQTQQLPTGMWQTMRYLMSEPVALATGSPAATAASSSLEPPKTEGILRLWRGVQTMMIGCIPAHALYFSSYEMVKAFWLTQSPTSEIVWYGSMMAGATATLGHDLIMAPLDTVKQRLQIGHYQGSMSFALKQMMQKEGPVALYRSFPVTLSANLPYGMIMVTTNESLKQLWTRSPDGGESQPLTLTTTMLASSMAGFVASAATTPLDRIKTLLQTQQMAPACWPTPPANCPRAAAAAAAAPIVVGDANPKVVQNAMQALKHILRHEGPVGLFRGMVPDRKSVV